MVNTKILQKLAEIIDEYLKNISKSSVVDYHKPDELKKMIIRDIPVGSFEDLFKAMDDYLRYSVKTNHSQYFNQLWGGFSMPAFLGDVIATLANTSMVTYEIAPVATLIERNLTGKMCDLYGFNEGEGIFVSGASNANLLAMLAARNEFFPDSKMMGMLSSINKEPALFISDQAHYSFLKAANVVGIGMNNVYKVNSDSNGRMISGELQKSINLALKDGKKPFFVAATAGTTVKGAFDRFEEIADISKKNNLWFHIDAALGGSLVFSKKYKRMICGCELADSIAWNAHKMMGVPITCSMLLTKKRGILYRTSSSTLQDENYIFHENETSSYDIGSMSLQCGRRVDALKLWFASLYYGFDGFEKRIDRLFELAEYAENKVKEIDELELMIPRQSINICFRHKAKDKYINEFNIKLREKLKEEGKSMVNYAQVEGTTVLRLVTLNPDIDFKDIDKFFDNILNAARELINT